MPTLTLDTGYSPGQRYVVRVFVSRQGQWPEPALYRLPHIRKLPTTAYLTLSNLGWSGGPPAAGGQWGGGPGGAPQQQQGPPSQQWGRGY